MMDNLLIIIATIAVLIIVFFLVKKKPNLSKEMRDKQYMKDIVYRQDQQHFVKEDQVRDHKEAEKKIKKT